MKARHMHEKIQSSTCIKNKKVRMKARYIDFLRKFPSIQWNEKLMTWFIYARTIHVFWKFQNAQNINKNTESVKSV